VADRRGIITYGRCMSFNGCILEVASPDLNVIDGGIHELMIDTLIFDFFVKG
jgi:hypothetical protein